MDYFFFLSLLLIIIPTLILYFFTSTAPKTTSLPLPPGPRQLPLIGNLHLFRNRLHHDLAKLSRSHGPVMALKLGQKMAVVISSPSAAKVALQKNNLLFSDRLVPNIATILDYANSSMLFLPSNKLWKQLRNISFAHVFSNKSLKAMEKMRGEKVRELVEFFRAEAGKPVDIGQAAFSAFLSITTSTLFSDINNSSPQAALEFRKLSVALIDMLGSPNISDFFPVFQPFDLKSWRQRRHATLYLKKLYSFVEEIIDRRLNSESVNTCNFLDVLLQLNAESKLERETIIALLADLLVGGTQTVTTTFEWAMAELLRNPNILEKARAELEQVLGTKEQVEESDIASLPYLQAVVKEVLRLHPPAPLIDRKSMEDLEISGYSVRKGTRLLVNNWAIGRDENVWPQPEVFMPERFLGSRIIDFRGRDFELMPFGSGRRMCPGMPFAVTMLHLTFASILREFEWKLPQGMEPACVDMRETFGALAAVAAPPLAIPIPVKTNLK